MLSVIDLIKAIGLADCIQAFIYSYKSLSRTMNCTVDTMVAFLRELVKENITGTKTTFATKQMLTHLLERFDHNPIACTRWS